METIEIREFKELPCGENPNQIAFMAPVSDGLEYEVCGEADDLEYIDYLNLSRVVEVLAEFFDVSAAALANDAMLCSAALGSSVQNAFDKILENEPVLISGGTIGFTKEITDETALQIVAMKVRNVAAPAYSKKALEILTKNAGMHIIKIKSPLRELLGFRTNDIKVTPFGYLIQEQNECKLTKESFRVSGKTKPTQQAAEDAIFAWKISKYIRSRSAVIAKDLAVRAIVQGGNNLSDTVERAMDIACETSKDAVLAVDGVIEQEQVINAAIQGRIGLIIEAGNSEFSPKLAKIADKYNISVIITGHRNNRY